MSFEQILSAPNKEWCDLYVHSITTTVPIIPPGPVYTAEAINATWGGIFSPSVPSLITASLYDNIATLQINTINESRNAPGVDIILDTPLPVAYRPPSNVERYCTVYVTGVGNSTILLTVYTTGIIIFSGIGGAGPIITITGSVSYLV